MKRSFSALQQRHSEAVLIAAMASVFLALEGS